MTIQECYKEMNEDYSEIYERLGNEKMIRTFVIGFMKDPSFSTLKEGLEEKDGEKAFRAAHTLKGVCLNLGFGELNRLSVELTEMLRGRDVTGTEEIFAAVEKKYNEMIDIIKRMEHEE